MEEEDHESLPVTGSNVMAASHQSINPIVSRRSNRDELLDEDDQEEDDLVVDGGGILGRLG